MDPDAKAMLDLAARAAFRGTGHVEPNPLVGCVIVRPGAGPAIERVIGIGHHRKFGDVHAEVDALRRCRELGHDPAGATAYVTLEPCNGHGRNPPCTKALVEARIGRVVCAAQDGTDGKGGGSAALRAVGIPCEFTDVSQRAIDLSAPWRHRQRTPLPWVIAKWAQTIDGKLATSTGDSKWISNDRSRLRVHRMRAAVDAIMVGGRTVQFDDPLLTARGVPVRREAIRVVATDTALPAGSALMRTAGEHRTVLFTTKGAPDVPGVEQIRSSARQTYWRDMLEALRKDFGVHTLLIEGGGGLVGPLLRHLLVNEIHVHIAPRVLAESAALGLSRGAGTDETLKMSEAVRWRLLSVRRVGEDVQTVYRLATRPVSASRTRVFPAPPRA